MIEDNMEFGFIRKVKAEPEYAARTGYARGALDRGMGDKGIEHSGAVSTKSSIQNSIILSPLV
jgi:hypothetical protein